MIHTQPPTVALESPPPLLERDEHAAEMEFLVGACANVDAELLDCGYDQLRLGQAHASRSLDLIRLCDRDTARHLMLMNANLFLEQAKALS